MELLGQIAAALLIAVVSSLITTQVALRKFRTERWWEAKVKAYYEIINAIYDHRVAADTYLLDILQNLVRSEDNPDSFYERSRKCREHLHRVRNVGTLYLSKEAMATIDEYINKLRVRRSKSEQDCLEAIISSSKTYLDKFIVVAKSDLKI